MPANKSFFVRCAFVLVLVCAALFVTPASARARALPRIEISTPEYPVPIDLEESRLIPYTLTESGNGSGRITSRTYRFYTQYGQPLSPSYGPFPLDLGIQPLQSLEWNEQVHLPAEVFNKVRASKDYALVLKTTFYGESGSGDPFRAESSLLLILPPAPFSKATPDSKSVIPRAGAFLTWKSSVGAVDYEYCFDTVDNNRCDTQWTGTYWPSTYGTTVSLPTLPPGTTFYWQVRANNTAGTTQANRGRWWTFTTCTPGPMTVTNTDDSGSGSLRHAMKHICSGGVIRFASSLGGQTITLASTLKVDKNLTIDGASLASRVSISGDNRVPVLRIPIGLTVNLKSLVITSGNGGSDATGGIQNNGTLTIENSLLSSNTGYFGGGIQNTGTLNIRNSTLTSNRAFEGGAILNSGNLQLSTSIISANQAENGGGIASVGTTTITNSTFTGNSATASTGKGGGVYNFGALTVENGTFSENSAGAQGGGIFNSNQPLTLSGSLLSNNTALSGGGIFLENGSATLTNVTFTGNSATNGGGAYVDQAEMSIFDSEFTSNTALETGGAILSKKKVDITRTRFANNTASNGGAIQLTGSGSGLFDSNSFENNTASSSGGALHSFNVPGVALTLKNNLFSGNSAVSAGGAVRLDRMSSTFVILENNTFYLNQAEAGGALSSDTEMELTNNTFSHNQAPSGGASLKLSMIATLYNNIFANSTGGAECVSSQPASGSHNLVEDGSGVCATLPGGLGGDPMLASLADNGASTQTMALLPGSPALDAGDDASCTASDQRGVTRPQGAHCDLGAFELEPRNTALHLSLTGSQTIGGVTSADEDILKFDGSSWSLLFDGSDVGVGSPDLFAFSFLDADSILMAFSANVTVNGIAATPQDVLRFDATSLGANTQGTWSMYFDGSDVGFNDATNEKIDALTLLSDGRLLLSTTGNSAVTGVPAGRDEDVLAFTPTSLGNNTSGAWAMYFDGSDVGLSESNNEDVDALDVTSNGTIYISTFGDFAVNGLSGADEDVFACLPTSIGDVTACNYAPDLYFDGSAWGLASNDVDAFHYLANSSFPSPTPSPTVTPTLTPTPTATLTPTPTATMCPQPTPEPLWVEPVTSPTGQTSQVIVVRIGNGDSVTVSSESGDYTVTGNFSTVNPALVTIPLLPNTTHHLTVSAHVKQVPGPGGCTYGNYTLTTTRDRLGAPLTILQSSGVPTTLTFTAAADARVSQSSPTTNYGTATTLQSTNAAGAVQTSYIRFQATGITGPVQSAKLRVFVTTNGTNNGPAAYLADNSWIESGAGGINWNNRPALLGSAVDNKGSLPTNSWVEYDVTGLVTADGSYTFALVADGNDGVLFSSREGATPPQLVLTLGSSGPTSTPTATATPSRTPTPTQTPTATPTGGSPQSFTFTPAADLYVDAGNPANNYGTQSTLRLDASPVLRSYLRFTVTGLNRPVTKATLRVYANSASSLGCSASGVGNNTWGETTTNYSNAPSLGGPLGSSGAFGAGTWINIDVTAYVTGNGTYSLALTTTSNTAISLASREHGVNVPQLIIETAP